VDIFIIKITLTSVQFSCSISSLWTLILKLGFSFESQQGIHHT